MKKSIFCSILISLSIMSYSQDSLQTISSMELLRYMGKWHEIALYPQRFERRCECTTAEYYLHEKYVEVRNTCIKNGKEKQVKGKAWVVPNSGNTKLKVQFFWPFKGDYWIIDLDEDYNWAVVSNPEKNYLWILSRSPKMEPELYRKIMDNLIKKGFDESKVIKTKHGCDN